MGRVIRDIKRKCPGEIPEKLKKALEIGQRIFEQERGSIPIVFEISGFDNS